MNDVKKLVIDRSKWHSGLGGALSRLVRVSDGKMCCLGFYGCALGGNPKAKPLDPCQPGLGEHKGLLGEGYPVKDQEIWPGWLFETKETCADARIGIYPSKGWSIANKLAWLNDNIHDQAEREKAIAAVFLENGVEVTFVDGEPEQIKETP